VDSIAINPRLLERGGLLDHENHLWSERLGLLLPSSTPTSGVVFGGDGAGISTNKAMSSISVAHPSYRWWALDLLFLIEL
jgi:hypothetical protein